MRCAIYRRVSTEIQKEEGFSLEAQKMRLEAFAESQGWTIVDDYSDEGYSAKNMDRPQLQRLITNIKKKKFDVVLVYRLDRFVRSVTDLHELLKLMDEYDVKFKSSTEVFDTTSATGRMFITIIATLAQWERETIAERVYEAMAKRSEKGLRNGGKAPYGYDSIDGNLIKNNEEAQWVKFIFDEYRTHGSRNIAKKMNARGLRTRSGDAWSDQAIRYILRNPIYSGYYRWGYETFTNGKRKKTGEEIISPIDQEGFEPIITKKEWDDTQKNLESRYTSAAFRSENHYPFSGVGRCAKCGKFFTGSKRGRKSGGEYRFYKCQGRFNYGICDVQTISEESMEKTFIEALELAEVTPEIEIEKKPKLAYDELMKKMEKVKTKKERLRELYIDGDITKDMYNKRLKKIMEEEKELAILLEEENEEISEQEIREVLKQIKNEWHNLSNESKKEAIHSMFESITFEVIESSRPGKNPIPPKLKITDYRLR